MGTPQPACCLFHLLSDSSTSTNNELYIIDCCKLFRIYQNITSLLKATIIPTSRTFLHSTGLVCHVMSSVLENGGAASSSFHRGGGV
jgi:hypothetical protein